MLTINDIDAARNNDEWLGWGYLGERERQTDVTLIALADNAIIDVANEIGATDVLLFEFLNSRLGRHFGDYAFGGWDASYNDLKKRTLKDLTFIANEIAMKRWS